jgi:hypothetical protein
MAGLVCGRLRPLKELSNRSRRERESPFDLYTKTALRTGLIGYG